MLPRSNGRRLSAVILKGGDVVEVNALLIDSGDVITLGGSNGTEIDIQRTSIAGYEFRRDA